MFPFDARYLEVQNGVQVLLGVLLMVIYARYIFLQGRLDWMAYRYLVQDGGKHSFRTFWSTLRTRVRAAIAILVYISGETGLRFWVWQWRHLENQQADTSWMTHYPMLMIFGLVSIAGALCVARVFSPDGWGGVGWIMGTIAAVGVAMALAIG